MDENVQNTEMQDAIPAEQETQQETDTVDTAATAPQEQQEAEDVTARDEGENVAQPPESEESAVVETAPFLSVQYNHADRPLTKEEAVNFVQIGMHHKELHNKLDYAAALSGVSVDELVERIIKAPEDAHRKHLEELYGEGSEDVEIGMNIFREKQSADYKKIIADREANAKAQTEAQQKSIQSRLADEYIELKKEIPDIPDFAQLPDSVIKEAASGKRDLLSAYLRYERSESKKIDAANKSQQAAAEASAGSMAQTEADNMSSFDKGFLEGLWGR